MDENWAEPADYSDEEEQRGGVLAEIDEGG